MTVRPSAPSRWKRSMRADPLHGVGAVEGLVEHQDTGTAGEGGGHLARWRMPLLKPPTAAVGDVEQADGGQAGVGHRRSRRRAGRPSSARAAGR